MIKGIKWYVLRLHFSDFARGPESSLETHVFDLVKKFKLVSATVLKESYHFHLFGKPESSQLFGSRPGSRPVIIEIFISEVKLDAFVKELEQLATEGKSNLLYSKHELNPVLGDPTVLEKLDEYKQ